MARPANPGRTVPIENHILQPHRLVYIENSGTITAPDVARNYNMARTLPGAHLVRHVLVDLRRVETLQAYFDGMAVVADLISTDGEDQPEPWDVALVSDRTGHLPLLLDYASRVRRSGLMRCEVLRDLPTAVRWLGLPTEVADEIERRRIENTAGG